MTLAPTSPADGPIRKLFYRIQEVARMTGLKPHVLRYWETEFRELAPAKDGADQRRYRPDDIEVVLAIRKLLYEDRFTIEGARKRLREELKARRPAAAPLGEPPAPMPRGTAARRPASPAPVSADRLDLSLMRLRHEVSDLLKMLS